MPRQGAHGVRQLQFAAGAVRGVLQNLKNRGRQHHPAQNGVVAHYLLRPGLFDHIRAGKAVALQRRNRQGAVFGNIRRGHFLYAHSALAVFLIGAAKLAGDRVVADDYIVPIQHRKRLVTYKVLGAQHRVTQTLGLLLADKINIAHLRALQHISVQIRLVWIPGEFVLQLHRMVKVVLNDPLAPVGDDQHILDPGGERLLYNVLNGGFIHNVEHFLGHGLGSGEHARAQPCCGNDCFFNFHFSFPRSVFLQYAGQQSGDHVQD